LLKASAVFPSYYVSFNELAYEDDHALVDDQLRYD